MASSARVPKVDDRITSARELREKYNSYINADPALVESRRWIEEVTRRGFKSDNFRESLADGILLCELIEIVGGIPLGRINRLPTAYAGIDNLNLFFKACERLGLKRLHLFDVADLQEVTPQRGDSITSRAKETQRRLQNVAITIFWLAKAAQNQGYQGPTLDYSCFDHLLPEVHFQSRKGREIRKRHSSGDLETKSRGTENIPPKKRDKVFDKIDIRDRKEKFRNLEKEAKKESAALESNRRRSTGGILKRIKHWDEEEGLPSRKENEPPKSKMPDPKFHEKQELYNRRGKQSEMGRSERVTSPPPISLGRKVEVDLKEKQRKFEGLDRQAEQQSEVLRGKTRPVSWGPREIHQALKKQNPVDVAFKEKHKNYEELQRQANTESAVLHGKLRPQFDRADGRPEKVPVATKTEVKLREKQKDFEQRDYRAQRESAVLQGSLRLSSPDSKEKRPNSVVVPKREQIKLDEKKATFEHLDRQAEQDTAILRGQHRGQHRGPPMNETDGRQRSSKVGLPRDSNVGLLEKQRTFEDMDYKARKESEILQKNKRKSFGSSVKEPMPLSTSTRPQIARFQSPSDRQSDSSDVRRRNQQERPPRPVSNYYEYRSINDYPESSKVNENASSEEPVAQVSVEEPMQSVPSYEGERKNYRGIERDLPKEDVRRAAEDRRRDYSDYGRRYYEESRRRRSSGEEPLEIDVSDAKNLSYRDMVRAPQKKSRDTFIRETNNVSVEEMPWRKEVREVKEKRHLTSDEEQEASYAAQPSSPRSELAKAQYLELVVPPSKKAVDSFANETETVSDEMPWRKEVKEIRRSPSGEDPPAFMSFTQAKQAEVTRIRPPSMKTRDAFVTTQDDKNEEEMPWRKEVRELKERPRTEDEDYRDESPTPEPDYSTAPNLRKLSYKELINVPSRKRRDVFQAQSDKEKEEMPWRKEVREIKRSTTEDEEERLQKSSATVAQSLEHDYRGPAYPEQVAKPLRKSRDSFVPYEEKQKEEMPWRKEVREIKRSITEDEQVSRSSVVHVHSSPEDQKDLRKFSYRDFVGKPRRKSESFVPSEEKEKEEMPWRKEVRELRGRPADEEQISQSTRSEVESAPNDALYRSFDTRESSNGSYPNDQPNVRKMSYKDFVCPPSKGSEPQGQVQRRSTKVKDITQRFATLEAEKHRPKESGPPSRKSLVDVAELQRIERDMKTRSWHGFPSTEYDSDNDYDVGRRRRTPSQGEEEERFRQQHQRENVSGLEELEDVFQDPEGYFDQIRGPPPEKNVEEESRAQYEAPSWDKYERQEQAVTVRATNDYDRYRPHDQSKYDQTSLYDTHRDGYYQKYPVRAEPLQERKSSDDRVVVKQSWIQPNHVELAEASASAARDNGPFTTEHYRDEKPRDYRNNDYYPLTRDDRNNEDYSKLSDRNEDKCFIEQTEFRQENQPYHPGYGQQKQFRKENEYWMSKETLEQLNHPMNLPTEDDSAMVFGGPIVVTAKRSQQSGEPDDVKGRSHKNYGAYDFVPAEVRPYEDRNDTKALRNDRDLLRNDERSYDNRDGIQSMQDRGETVEKARSLVLQNIKNLRERDVEPPEKTQTANRPQVFGVFARTDPKENKPRDDLHERQSSELPLEEKEDSFQGTRRGSTHYLNEHDQENPQDWKTEKGGVDNSWYMESQPLEESFGYENSVSNHTELHPTVVSMVESQTQEWGNGAFDASPQQGEQRKGRRRVMNFSNDHEDEVVIENKNDVFQTTTEPVPVEVNEKDRRREQKEKEKMMREQLRDAEYRERYRKEFEEKNRKQRENSKYLMSLQMRAALGPDDEDYGGNAETQREDDRESEQQKSQDYDWKTTENPRLEGDVSDDDLVQIVAVEEDYWHHKKDKKKELEKRETSRQERPRRKKSEESQPRINGIDFVGEDHVIHREYKDFEQEARLRKLKAEEELMAQEAERLVRERAALQQQKQAEEPVITPVEKPPVELTINEEALNSFLAEDKKDESFYDENRNRNLPKTRMSGQRDVFFNGEEYPPQKELEVRDKERYYSDKPSNPQAEVLPINGYHHESEPYPEAPAEIPKQNGDFPGHPATDPEVNEFEGYSIYETFIHGESNHVICMSCGTSIEKSPAMYIAELDRYWHVNCFSCVVCRAWFGDEYSPVLQITNSMLHCERCYITSEGERCTEV